ncbi:MAG: Asp-tRNA(Asn)/Glu-tRNA(Gln) amidotransferase subunit GatC [Sphingomonadaceae bacterium]|nr:Asp-tRNA(Asn)/Glu-tRNA(Gln) amidotransferase subunit GatC [Sphingomonadaceae bacterium]
MAVDLATVTRIAKLARLRLAPGEAEPLVAELNGILRWIEQLGEVDTAGVEPMAAVIPNHLRWRPDAVTDGGVAAAVLANAPASEAGFFAVPKVIE